MNPLHIPESRFHQHTVRQLQRLAQDLKATGLTIAEISRITRMNWDTVYKAMNRRPIRFDNAERLRFFVKQWQQEQDAAKAPAPAPVTDQPKPATPPRGKGGRFTKKEETK